MVAGPTRDVELLGSLPGPRRAGATGVCSRTLADMTQAASARHHELVQTTAIDRKREGRALALSMSLSVDKSGSLRGGADGVSASRRLRASLRLRSMRAAVRLHSSADGLFCARVTQKTTKKGQKSRQCGCERVERGRCGTLEIEMDRVPCRRSHLFLEIHGAFASF